MKYIRSRNSSIHFQTGNVLTPICKVGRYYVLLHFKGFAKAQHAIPYLGKASSNLARYIRLWSKRNSKEYCSTARHIFSDVDSKWCKIFLTNIAVVELIYDQFSLRLHNISLIPRERKLLQQQSGTKKSRRIKLRWRKS